MVLTLNVEKRTESGKNNRLRAEGKIPAVLYGKKQESTPVSIKLSDFAKVWKQAGESTVVVLKSSEGDFETLIYDVAVDPVTDTPIHADFYAFEKGKKLKVEVPLEFIGVAPAVKDLGGTLAKIAHEISIEAEPSKLPQEINVDISVLIDFESQIHARNLVLPEGVELAVEPDEVIAFVAEPKEEEEEVAAEGIDSIEVVGEKGKEESEDTPGETKPE